MNCKLHLLPSPPAHVSGQLWESGHSQIHLELSEGRSLFLQADSKKETDVWFQALRAARNAGKGIEDQLLTKVRMTKKTKNISVVYDWFYSDSPFSTLNLSEEAKIKRF